MKFRYYLFDTYRGLSYGTNNKEFAEEISQDSDIFVIDVEENKEFLFRRAGSPGNSEPPKSEIPELTPDAFASHKEDRERRYASNF